MKLVEGDITLAELKTMSKRMYDGLVKAVVDIERNLLVVDAEMHSDQEQYLLELNSKQENLWGVNLYPDKYGTDEFIEFDSMINLRPSQQNLSRGINDSKLRNRIIKLINNKVKKL